VLREGFPVNTLKHRAGLAISPELPQSELNSSDHDYLQSEGAIEDDVLIPSGREESYNHDALR
jgi:hypothetical protein